MQIVIDHRETKLKEIITQDFVEKYNVIYENLELGDVIIYYKGDPLFIFERKTLPDLRASIIDGRYKNQKLRIIEKYGPCVLKYIIEGDNKDFGTLDNIVKGSIINTILRDKVSIFKTKNVEDTLSLMKEIFERVGKDPEKYIVGVGQESEQLSGSFKKESTFVNMLSQIPSISLKTAKAIQASFPSLYDLYSKIKDLNDEQKLNVLKSITTTDNKGKSRKLSSKACANLVSVLFENTK